MPSAKMHQPGLWWLMGILVVCMLFANLPAPAPLYASEWQIPDGDTTALIQAIEAANTTPGLDTIDLAPYGMYVVTASDDIYMGANAFPRITSPIVINGNGATISRNSDPETPAVRFFAIAPSGTLTLHAVTLTNGLNLNNGLQLNGIAASASAGAIYNDGALTIEHSSLIDNHARGADGDLTPQQQSGGSSTGGAIYNTGTLTIRSSTLSANSSTSGAGAPGTTGSGNMAWGGAIHSHGSRITIDSSILSENYVYGGNADQGHAGPALGGAISIGGDTTLINATSIISNATVGGMSITGPRGGASGGGIYAESSDQITLINSTLSGNQANGAGGTTAGIGGGVVLGASSRLFSYNSTIVHNRSLGPDGGGSGGGIYAFQSARATFKHTIIANNQAANGPDCLSEFNGLILSSGYNLFGIGAGCNGTAIGDLNGTAASPLDPQLAPLASGPGATLIHHLLADSPALDQGGPTTCTDAQGAVLLIDQHARQRPADGNNDGSADCDTGSSEYLGIIIPTASPTATPSPTHTPTASPTATPSPTPTPTATPSPTPTPTASPTATPSPTPTPTASPTATPSPTPTPMPSPLRRWYLPIVVVAP